MDNRRDFTDLVFREEPEGACVYAMARIFFCEFLSEKNMSEVTTAIAADDFRTPSVGIGDPPDCAWDLVIKAWPSAVGIKFIRGLVKTSIAPAADVDSGIGFQVVVSRKREVCPLSQQHALFFRGQLVVIHEAKIHG